MFENISIILYFNNYVKSKKKKSLQLVTLFKKKKIYVPNLIITILQIRINLKDKTPINTLTMY